MSKAQWNIKKTRHRDQEEKHYKRDKNNKKPPDFLKLLLHARNMVMHREKEARNTEVVFTESDKSSNQKYSKKGENFNRIFNRFNFIIDLGVHGIQPQQQQFYQ